jgi:hypothetical protein
MRFVGFEENKVCFSTKGRIKFSLPKKDSKKTLVRKKMNDLYKLNHGRDY